MASRLDDLIREHAERLDQLAGPIDLTDVTSAPRNDTTNVAFIDIEPTWSQPEGRHRWPIIAVAAAAVVAVVVGGLMIATRTDDPTGEVPADQPTTVAPSTTAPNTETGFVALHDGLSVTFTVPKGWDMWGQGLVHPKHGNQGAAGVRFFDVGNVFADGCQQVLVDPPVGPTVDDLVSAFANLRGLAPTAAVDITVDGYVGKQIEIDVPDYNAGECKGPMIPLWQEVGKYSFTYSPSSGNHIQLWILDVGGTRLVIAATTFEDTPPQFRAVLDQILATIQIG